MNGEYLIGEVVHSRDRNANVSTREAEQECCAYEFCNAQEAPGNVIESAFSGSI